MNATALLALVRNPVIVKEVRTRMRGWRAFMLVTLHLAGLCLILGLTYLVFKGSLSANTNLEERQTFGKLLFGMLVILELVMISFTAPAMTAGAIANEHERQTYDLLRVTLLRPSALVLGKYVSGLTFVLLLLFTALPLLGPAFLIGGITPQEIIISLLVLLVTALTICAVSLFFSTLTTRTLVATVLSYAFSIMMSFGLSAFMLFGIALLGINFSSNTPSLLVQVLLIFFGWLTITLSPASALIASEVGFLDGQGIWGAVIDISNGEVWVPLPWIGYVIIYMGLTVLFLWLSIQRVKRLEK